MKKILCFAMALVMLLGLAASAFAADMGVVPIVPVDETEPDPVNLDDMKINTEYDLDGWGVMTLTSCAFADRLYRYDKGGYTGSYKSGEEADYLLLHADIVNTTLKPKNYLADVTVKAVFNEDFEYSGWAYQYDLDRGYSDYVIYPDDNFVIEPMYAGHYVFGCALPNAIVNSKNPLQLIFTVDGNEFTFNVRK